MSFVMSLDFEDFFKLINKMYEKREEQKAWEMYLMKYQHMGKKDHIEFKDFYQKQREPTEIRPKDDILQEVEAIREAIRKKKGGE